jgi:hypothetical protein
VPERDGMKHAIMEIPNTDMYTMQCIASHRLFSGFDETYEDYYYSILTVEKPFLTLIYLRALQSNMEKEGMYLPTVLSERFAELLAANPDVYVNLEPA